jgi:hypothetical protein
MTDSAISDLAVVLARLDDLHDGLTATQQAMLTAIVARAAADPTGDEVRGFLLGDALPLKAAPVKPSAFTPQLKGIMGTDFPQLKGIMGTDFADG